jgi:anti-sigma regulatory factor (Ser/Thr protein kinase)
MTLEVQATPEDVMRAVEALQEFSRSQGVPEKTIFGLALALEECGSNVINHALQRDARQSSASLSAARTTRSSSKFAITVPSSIRPQWPTPGPGGGR